MSVHPDHLGKIACAWCTRPAVSPWVAKVERWVEREDRREWLCPGCGRASLVLEHRLVQLLAAFGCRHGVIPKIVFEAHPTAKSRVSLDPGTVVALFVSDEKAEAARRAFEDFTTLPPERVVLVRDGATWKVEEKTGVVPDVVFKVWIH